MSLTRRQLLTGAAIAAVGLAIPPALLGVSNFINRDPNALRPDLVSGSHALLKFKSRLHGYMAMQFLDGPSRQTSEHMKAVAQGRDFVAEAVKRMVHDEDQTAVWALINLPSNRKNIPLSLLSRAHTVIDFRKDEPIRKLEGRTTETVIHTGVPREQVIASLVPAYVVKQLNDLPLESLLIEVWPV